MDVWWRHTGGLLLRGLSIYPRTTLASVAATVAAGYYCTAVACTLVPPAAGSKSDAQQQDEKQLGNLWAAVVEVMLCEPVAGEDVFLVPSEPGSAPPSELQPLPPLLRTHTVFALTAFDPPGEMITPPNATQLQRRGASFGQDGACGGGSCRN